MPIEPYIPAYMKDYDIQLVQGQDWSWPFRLKPRDDQGVLYVEDTTGYTATMTVRAPDASGAVQFTVTSAGGGIQVGFTPAKVIRNTAYSLGQKVVPIALNGYVYECTVAGTTHATNEPTWPTTLTQTVADGTVTWRCETTDALVANLYVLVPAATTEGMTPWGRGTYSLEVRDTFTHTWFYADGAAYLRQESTY